MFLINTQEQLVKIVLYILLVIPEKLEPVILHTCDQYSSKINLESASIVLESIVIFYEC